MKGNADEGPVLSSDQRLVDKVLEWEQKAAEQYKEDGFSDGWNSDESEPETAEQRYIRVCLGFAHAWLLLKRRPCMPLKDLCKC